MTTMIAGRLMSWIGLELRLMGLPGREPGDYGVFSSRNHHSDANILKLQPLAFSHNLLKVTQ